MAGAMVIASCTASLESPENGPWKDEIAAALKDDFTPYLEEVLADGKISESEMGETQDRLIACLSDGGIADASFDPDGLGGWGFPTPANISEDEVNRIVGDCENNISFPVIQMLYLGMRNNPQNIDFNIVVAQCLVAKGVVHPGFSADDYRQAKEDRHTEKEEGKQEALEDFINFTDKAKGLEALIDCERDPQRTLNGR